MLGQRAAAAQEKAAQRAEGVREAVVSAVAAIVDAGCVFAEGFHVTQGQSLTATALKALQQAAKAKTARIYE